MMRGVVPALEKHHNVRILDDGVAAAVRLSHRYLPDRQLPDKAVSVLDTACARLSLGQNATPPAIEDAKRQLDDLDVQTRVLQREMLLGADHGERLAEIGTRRARVEAQLAELEPRWTRERDLVQQVRAARQQIEDRAGANGAKPATGDEKSERSVDELRGDLDKLNRELEQLQGEKPLVPVCVDGALVGQVISGWTGIPVGKMLRDDLSAALQLEKSLQRRIIGQDHALEIISRRIRTSKAGIEDPQKPIGVFLLVGPSGVGKTETALALADLLYGGEQNVITINMSEFQESHTVSTLKGSPPGYVGYGEGGVLTEAVRRRPYSVVLLDEIEKAHPDVLELFFQVFDKGRMEDGEGREIDFKNTIILLTTNAGSELITNMCKDPELLPDPEALAKALREPLLKVFPPALLGRIVTIPYYPLSDQMLGAIIRLQIGRIKKRIEDNHAVSFSYSDEVVGLVSKRCTEMESGGRMIDAILTNTVLPRISEEFLKRMMAGEPVKSVSLAVAGGDFAYNFG